MYYGLILMVVVCNGIDYIYEKYFSNFEKFILINFLKMYFFNLCRFFETCLKKKKKK